MDANEIKLTQRTRVKVEVIQAAPLRWDGKQWAKGEQFDAYWYEVEPAVTHKQVKLVAVLPKYDPDAPPEAVDMMAGTEPGE